MKKVEVVAELTKIEAIKQALWNRKVGTMLLTNALAAGPGVSRQSTYRGVSYAADVERVALQVVVADHDVDDTLQALCDAASGFSSGEIDVTISCLDDVIRIRSGPAGAHLY